VGRNAGQDDEGPGIVLDAIDAVMIFEHPPRALLPKQNDVVDASAPPSQKHRARRRCRDSVPKGLK
jgi:hypothetical protein